MKKYILSFVALFGTMAIMAQNVQLHYDFGRHLYKDSEAGRQKVTATYEQFKADELGSWYYFADFDLGRRGVRAAYTEISREFNLKKDGPFAAHIEYDGGLNEGGVYQSAALIGPAYNGHNADFSTTYSVQVLYKQFFKGYGGQKAYASAQLTGVWSTKLLNDKLTFAGFIDLWRGQKANGHGQLVILTEPQLWYNVNKYISVGTEVEFSDNFIYNTNTGKTAFINPTLALKYNF